jgi:hypothetical protein
VHKAIENVNMFRAELAEIDRKLREINEASKKGKEESNDDDLSGV